MNGVLSSAAFGQLYSRFGLTGSDESNYKNLAQRIPSCSEADRAIPDVEHIHVTAKNDIARMLHAVQLDVVCRIELKKVHAALPILRMTDYRRGMTCLALNIADPDDERVNAPCNSASAL